MRPLDVLLGIVIMVTIIIIVMVISIMIIAVIIVMSIAIRPDLIAIFIIGREVARNAIVIAIIAMGLEIEIIANIAIDLEIEIIANIGIVSDITRIRITIDITTQ